MFTLKDYVGIHIESPDWTEECQDNANSLIDACTDLQEIMEGDGVKFHINPKTGTTISGEIYGGFRPQNCPIGAPNSSHKLGMAVDRYDPDNYIDQWINSHLDALIKCGIYVEDQASTPGWSHWQIRPTHNHIFLP